MSWGIPMVRPPVPVAVLRAPVRVAGLGVRACRELGEAVRAVACGADAPGLRGPWRPGVVRVAAVGEQRLYLSVPELRAEPTGPVVPNLVEAARTVPGVQWAAANAALGCLVVAVEEQVDRQALVSAVEQARAALPPTTASVVPTRRHPADPIGLGWRWLAFATSATAVPFAWAAARAPRAPLAAEIAGLATFADLQPRVRAAARRVFGPDGGDAALAAVGAVAQAAAGGVFGLTVDSAIRALRLSEARARAGAWATAEPELVADPHRAEAPFARAERPIPLPMGRPERYVTRNAAAAGAAFTLSLLASHDPRRAAGTAVATLPKGAALARDGFTHWLARGLADRGAVVLDLPALDRLDRVDTVLLDERVLTTGRHMLEDLELLPGCEHLAAEAAAAAHRLFDPARADACHSRDRYTLHPVPRPVPRQLPGPPAPGPAVRHLQLSRDGEQIAVLSVVAEPTAAAGAVLRAARRCGVQVVLCSENLPDRVRALQSDGAVVLAVTSCPLAAAAADVGIGVSDHQDVPPWPAHVLVRRDLTLAALLCDALPAARTTSARGVRLAQAATVLGAVTALTGRGRRHGRRALLFVNGAAVVALAGGMWSANEVLRRPTPPPDAVTPWHAMPTDVVLAELGTGPDGLAEQDVRRRLRAAPHSARPSLWHTFLAELDNPLTPILGAGAALSAAVGAATDAIIVAGSGALSAALGAAQRDATQRSMLTLTRTSAIPAQVRRNGTEATVRPEQLVPGDVIVLGPGDLVPADCRILDAYGVEVDESALTGESLPVPKSAEPVLAAEPAERTSMLHEGSTLAAGRATAVVVATGSATEARRAGAANPTPRRPSGVDARLAQLTRVTLPIAIGSAAAVIAAGLLRGRALRGTIGAGVGLAVASVPEGLPLLVSAAQLAAARRLSRRGALVRNQRTVEALGRVDVLCFDKTGTLTEGRITLAGVHDGTRAHQPAAFTDEDRAILAAAARATPQPGPGGRHEHLTDAAVAQGATAAGARPDLDASGWRQADVLPFEPSRGYHATVGYTEAGPVLSVKGSPEAVIRRCRTGPGGELTARRRKRLLRLADDLAGAGQRILAVAESHPDGDPGALSGERIGDLRFRGFLMLADPVRETAPAALARLAEAGVQTVMITGDHPHTARAVAEDLGILNGHHVVTGTELDALDDDELDGMLSKVAVIARVSPVHKVRVVESFQRIGCTVAMTGDGANDAPAIRLADVGIAIGEHATPAARDAADLVVPDGRLDSIIAALIEGRSMWASVRAGLSILVGGNLGEIAYTVLGALLTGQAPLGPRQLLLVNLLTDLAPAVTVAMRPADAEPDAVLREGPEAALGGALNTQLAVRAAATAGAAGAAWFTARLTGRTTRARTVGLVALVTAQLGQTLTAGGANRAVLLASGGSTLALLVVVQTPGLSQFFGCTPLGPVGWGIALTSAAAATAAANLAPRAFDRAVRGR